MYKKKELHAHLQQQDTTAYDKAIAEVITRIDWSYRKKFKFIRNALMEEHGLSLDEAESYSKELLRD